MLENGSQESLIRKVRISVSLSIKLLETGGESLEKNETVDEAIKLETTLSAKVEFFHSFHHELWR